MHNIYSQNIATLHTHIHTKDMHTQAHMHPHRDTQATPMDAYIHTHKHINTHMYTHTTT